MLGCHVSGHPRQLALDFVAVDGLRKNHNNGTPRLGMRIQTTPNLAEISLVKLSRLSVGVIKKAEFDLILKMSESES